MKLFILTVVIFSTFYCNVTGQKAVIYEQKVNMKTYMFSDPNPVPDINKSYPYCRFDGYTNQGKQQEWNMVILENDYIKVFITPEIGGKIWGAIEKSTGGEFLYYNDVVKFRDLALRGPWTSGGLELNFGLMSHVSTCATPQDYIIKENADGSVSCVIGAIDLHTRTRWNVEIILPKNKAYVETVASWFNTCSVPVTYYHYMNAAAKTEGNLEFIYPGSHHIGHGGEVGEWPVDNGRDISFYENNNFGPYKSYHVLNAYTDYMGGYWHAENFGFGHLCDYDERPGKKLWIWGLSQQGMIWEDLLTDTKGQYIEFQSGKLFNQAMVQSSYTPFKHREFIPHDSDIMKEIWFPLKGTGGMVSASRYGVLNVVRKGDSVEIRLSALQDLNEILILKIGERVILDEKVILKPLDLYITKVVVEANEEFSIELGDHLLDYSSTKKERIVNRPLKVNTHFDWNSAIGLYTKGLELEKQQSYIDGNAYALAHELYIKSLEKDPAYALALNRLGLSYYRRMEYVKALDPILKSMAIDTYDPEANYLYGLINAKLHKYDEAKSGFSIAAQSTTFRTASYTELAKLFLVEKRYSKAAEYAQKALMFNQHNIIAMEILAVTYRLTNKLLLWDEVLKDLYELDETDPFVASERIMSVEKDLNSLRHLITNELPFETYLSIAIRYYTFGFQAESIKILKAAPEHVTVLLWLAFLDVENKQHWLEKAIEKSPEFVFPFREETLMVLDHLMKTENDWKLKYYASLIYWKKDLNAQAMNLMHQCGNDPDYAPFYLAKAILFDDEPVIKKEAILKAKSLAETDWRVNLAWINQLMAENKYEEAGQLSKNTLGKKPEMAILGISYATALLKSEEYRKCLDFLDSFQVLPYEGANEGRNIYHEACIRAAYGELHKKKSKNAINYAEKAKLWPINLGAGRPYDVDERLENYLLAYCYEKMGNNSEADRLYNVVADYKIPDDQNENVLFSLRIAALKKLNRKKEANDLLQKIEMEEPDNIYIKWVSTRELQGDSESLTQEIMTSEIEKTPINNKFLLVNELFSIIK